jgi:hypothetical protein
VVGMLNTEVLIANVYQDIITMFTNVYHVLLLALLVLTETLVHHLIVM